MAISDELRKQVDPNNESCCKHCLSNKCKEWAYSQGYIISSGLTPVLGVNKDGWAEVFSSSTPLDGKLHTFKQLSEPEAIIKACEWILTKDNK